VVANSDPGLQLDVLVVDNGGGAETMNVVREFGARYLRCSSGGAAAARNRGLEDANGEYIAFLDDDDVWTPCHLRQQVDWLVEHPDFGAVLGRVQNIDHELKRAGLLWPESLPYDGRLFAYMLRLQPQLGATVIKRSVLESVGYFDETLLGDEDWDWHLRLALTERIGFLPTTCVLFRARPLGSDDERLWQRFPYVGKVFWGNVRRGGKDSPARPLALLTYLHHLGTWHGQFLRSAKVHARSGRRSNAQLGLRRAARISPLHFAWSLIRDSEARRVAMIVLLPAGAARREPGT
jgi:glycosyltransferase involved in cell wall biosynthesis